MDNLKEEEIGKRLQATNSTTTAFDGEAGDGDGGGDETLKPSNINGDGEKFNWESNESERTTEAETTEDEPICVDILGNGKLMKIILEKSNLNERPRRGNLVTINLIGKLRDGTIVEQAVNLQLHVGDFEVVQGLDMALPLMNLKEKARIEIGDPRLAYGNLGLKNAKSPFLFVPPGAVIFYEIELLEIKDENFDDLESFELNELRREHGKRKKERANFWYNRGEYNIAIQLYRRALDYLEARDVDDGLVAKSLLDERLIVYNNLAIAQIKILAFDAALKSVETVLHCQPNNSKALYRKGKILEGKGDVKAAIVALQKAATLKPDSRTIQQDLAKLIIKARREEHNEKELYQKMLGQAKRLEEQHKLEIEKRQENLNENEKRTDENEIEKCVEIEKRSDEDDNANPGGKWLRYLMASLVVGLTGAAIYRFKY